MATVRDDDYSRLKQSVDEWVAEVAQTRSALAQTLKVHVTARPAFRLRAGVNDPAAAARVSDHGALERREEFHRRILDAERSARDAEAQLARMQQELDFAREQLHLQNRLRAEAEAKQETAEQQYIETVHALGGAQLSVDELRRQLRGKEWALENALNAAGPDVESAPPDIEPLQREAAALHSRLETLTIELQAARERAEREHHAALDAQSRLDRLESGAERSNEIVEGLSRQVQEYAERLRETGRELDEARAALGGLDKPGASRSQLADAELALQLAERRAEDLARALDDSERDAVTKLSEAIAEAAVLSDNYDALAASHMVLRDEIVSLQERIVARDHELAQLKQELARRTVDAPDHSERVAELTRSLDAREQELEDLEVSAAGHELLVKALRRELEASREALQRAELDHSLLKRALVAEVEGLRDLAAERDFVIGHQAAQLDAVQLAVSVPQADAAELGRESVMREIQILRQRIEDKDAIVRRLRGELAEAEERASAGEGAEELKAALRNREADLDRARERVGFLRKLLAETAMPAASEQSETPTETLLSVEIAPMRVKQTETPVRTAGVDDIDVSRYQANAEIQREVEQSLALRSLWPVLAIVGGVAGLGFLALIALAFMLG